MILLDTNALVWLANGDERLGIQARTTIQETRRKSIAVSAICFWELGLLIGKNRIVLPLPLADFATFVVSTMGIESIPVSTRIAVESGILPAGLHGDPGDRLIVATARALSCVLLTSDGKLLRYGSDGHVQAVDARR